jgi:hypothetical protein
MALRPTSAPPRSGLEGDDVSDRNTVRRHVTQRGYQNGGQQGRAADRQAIGEVG